MPTRSYSSSSSRSRSRSHSRSHSRSRSRSYTSYSSRSRSRSYTSYSSRSRSRSCAKSRSRSESPKTKIKTKINFSLIVKKNGIVQNYTSKKSEQIERLACTKKAITVKKRTKKFVISDATSTSTSTPSTFTTSYTSKIICSKSSSVSPSIHSVPSVLDIPILLNPTHRSSFSIDPTFGTYVLDKQLETNAVVIDGRNLIHSNQNFTVQDEYCPNITKSNIKRLAMRLASFFASLKCKEIIFVLSQKYADCASYAQVFYDQYFIATLGKENLCATLKIVEYIGADGFTNGDDILALKLAIKMNATLVSNDKMNKREDAIIFDKVRLNTDMKVHASS